MLACPPPRPRPHSAVTPRRRHLSKMSRQSACCSGSCPTRRAAALQGDPVVAISRRSTDPRALRQCPRGHSASRRLIGHRRARARLIIHLFHLCPKGVQIARGWFTNDPSVSNRPEECRRLPHAHLDGAEASVAARLQLRSPHRREDLELVVPLSWIVQEAGHQSTSLTPRIPDRLPPVSPPSCPTHRAVRGAIYRPLVRCLRKKLPTYNMRCPMPAV